MLTIHQLTKSFNLTTLFENVTFSVNAGECVGLIGANGSGKTTLLRIIAGVESADSGHVSHANGLRIGYLPQGFELNPTLTVAQTIEAATGNIDALENELAELAMRLVDAPDDRALHDRYDAVLAQMLRGEGRDSAEIITSLQLDTLDQALPVGLLSGGQKTRLALALLLLDQPQLLLLDEPTNHLDISMLEWLEKWLANFRGGVLLISHDRAFLDQSVSKIIALDREQRRATQYAGNYSDYLQQWQQQQEKQMAAYRDQVAEIKRMKRDIAHVRETARKNENRSTSVRKGGEKMRASGYKDYVRSKAKATAKVAKAREKKLNRFVGSDTRVEKPKSGWQMAVDFSGSVHLGRSVLHLDKLSVGYTKEAPLLQIDDLFLQANQRVVLAGPNGCGKTTLLKTISGYLPALVGTAKLGSSVKLGYMTQEQSLLDLTKSPTELLLANGMGNQTDARNYLHRYLFTGSDATKPCAQLSFGQRARLELALLVAKGCNLLLLDEPINHLDIPSRTLFEQALLQFNGTTLAVVHDRYFIKRFASTIWWVVDGTIQVEIVE
ncbi:MAG TPA: ABC-F family ATP-binding cassette domain-containing protein, partial [Anaerolineae bacterium]|nr:ABC-F family ATP-binding cassette domain-containing protein [Anaerolineae bacterium]